MPKQIEHLSDQLLAETGRQLADRGYARTTIRSVAQACGIAVGTVYNYFPSKEMLVASFVSRDWQQRLSAMESGSRESPETCLRTMHGELLAFAEAHRALFTDPEAAKAASGVLLARHLQLREQLSALIEPFAPSPGGFTAQFIAEALLTWTLSRVPFEQIYELIAKLIPNQSPSGGTL